MSLDAMRWAKTQQTGSATRKAVLMAIADYADEHGVAWPSQERIAADTELSERSVRGAISDLEEAGFLERKSRRRGDGTRNTDRMYLAMTSNRQELPLDAGQPANGAKTTGSSCQNHRQIASEPPAPAAGKPSLGEPPVGNRQLNGHSEANASATATAVILPLRDRLWLEGPIALVSLGLPEKQSKSIIGRWLRDHDGDAGRILWAIEEAVTHGSGDPIPYVTRLLSERSLDHGKRTGPHPARNGGGTKFDHVAAGLALGTDAFDQRSGRRAGHDRGRADHEAGADDAGPSGSEHRAEIAYLSAYRGLAGHG